MLWVGGMNSFRSLTTLVVSTVAVVTLLGCPAKNPEAVSSSARETLKPVSQPPAQAQVAPAETSDSDATPKSFGPIYYTLDSAQLTETSLETLRRLGEYLQSHPRASVEIAGHTCELGTTEYNVALGQQRAEAVKKYLVALGVASNRVSTVSYGEERPADSGSGEGAFSHNRRSEFDLRVVEVRAGR